MLILTIRTDKPEAELGLFEADQQLEYFTWQAHRQLAETIHIQIKRLLDNQERQLSAVQAIAFYSGTGSFTGLRIGASVANALAASLPATIVGETGEDWRRVALARLASNQNDQLVVPEYGAPPHITTPKH